MRIVRMYSGNLAASQDWKKVEVEVDEHDLSAILYEVGVDLDVVPRHKITSGTVFKILTYEAEILLKTTMAQSFSVDVESVKADLAALKIKKQEVLASLVEKLGV